MKADISLDEEELLSMAVDYLKKTTANEKTSKRPREEKEYRRATRKKRRSQSIKKRSNTKETVPTPTGSSHSQPHTRNGNDMCWESALEGYVNGYADCTQEAVRYLLEEEGLFCTDQVIGLRNHLRGFDVAMDNNNHSNNRSAESLRGPSLVCYHPMNSAGFTPPSPVSHELPPIHELMSTFVNAIAVPLSSVSPTSLPHGSETVLTLSNTPLTPPTTPESMTALTRGRRMEPLTVDTNQEYELPSYLQCQADAAKKSKESLLTIAHTKPTVSRPVYTQSTVAHKLAPVALTAQTMPLEMSCSTQRLGMEKTMASNSVVGRSTCGFNLNYAAPYVYAWVKPAH